MIDFDVLGTFCYQPHSNQVCISEQIQTLRNHILVIGYSPIGKIITNAYHKSYTNRGILSLRQLNQLGTTNVIKQSRLWKSLYQGSSPIKSAILLNDTGLLMITYQQGTTTIESLTDNSLLQHALSITKIWPPNLASNGMFVWQGQLYTLDNTGVLNCLPIDTLLQRIIRNINSDKLINAFFRFSVEQFFKCNCSTRRNNFVRLVGVNDLVTMYNQLTILTANKNLQVKPYTESKILIPKLIQNLSMFIFVIS